MLFLAAALKTRFFLRGAVATTEAAFTVFPGLPDAEDCRNRPSSVVLSGRNASISFMSVSKRKSDYRSQLSYTLLLQRDLRKAR